MADSQEFAGKDYTKVKSIETGHMKSKIISLIGLQGSDKRSAYPFRKYVNTTTK